MSDLTERLNRIWADDHERGCQGREYPCTCGFDEAAWKTAKEAADEIDRLTRELAEARDAQQIEIDDGVLIYREGGLSITVCAETATVYDIDSAMPAVKVPLEYAAVHDAIDARALKEKP